MKFISFIICLILQCNIQIVKKIEGRTNKNGREAIYDSTENEEAQPGARNYEWLPYTNACFILPTIVSPLTE
jgi:hypothetical protein